MLKMEYKFATFRPSFFMSSARSSQSSRHKVSCSSTLLISLNVLFRLRGKKRKLGGKNKDVTHSTVLILHSLIPFCAHALSFFMSDESKDNKNDEIL